jgi:hypothetical protein
MDEFTRRHVSYLASGPDRRGRVPGRTNMTPASVLAHVAGLPVEEMLVVALAGGTTASLGLRLAWRRVRPPRRRRGDR